jgi:hypothetical protein
MTLPTKERVTRDFPEEYMMFLLVYGWKGYA